MEHPEQNPYAAPTVVAVAPADALSDDERIRTEHIGCEQELRSLGWVMVLGGVFVALFAVELMSRSRGPDSGLLLLSVIVLAMFAQVVAGIGLLMLRRWALAPAIIDSALWLLFLPIGTVIALAALWTLSRSRVAFVLTDEYRALISRTPGVRYKTPRHVWAILLLVTLAVLALVALVMGAA